MTTSANLLGVVEAGDCVLFLQVVDIPTIVESLKTIDNKSFYKTADICQVCFIIVFGNTEIPLIKAIECNIMDFTCTKVTE